VIAVGTIPERVHLVGAGGIHMSGIARILCARGHTITGSDLHLTPLTAELEKIGVTVREGHSAEQVGDAQLVVYTSAAQADNPEVAEAIGRGIETIKRAEMVARMMEGKKVVAIAGSHGKTTTTSLVAFMLHRAGLSPTIMLGGESIDLGTNALPGDGDYFVVEADEYDRAFLNYRPHIALVTNLEPDHLDIYGTFEELQAAFKQFLSQVENDGYILACGDSPSLQAILPPAVGDDTFYPVRVVSYGQSDQCDWRARAISQKGIDTSTFVVEFQKQVWGDCMTRLPGVHNVVNSLGAIAVGQALGLERGAILDAVENFRGVKRRFELVGEAGGVRVMDSYAHHPSEVRADLAAARNRFPGRRIVCLFQPHTYSRTAYLLAEFRTCFQDCDVLYIADTYAARERPSAGMDAEQLAREITEPSAFYAGAVSEAASVVSAALRPGDVFFTIGAGDVDKAGPLVLNLLPGGSDR
jgi:UDP-N-acetylmuramate--alanine ligase